MLSLNKVHNKQDLLKWLNKIETNFCVEQKLDGVSLVLHYQEAGTLRRIKSCEVARIPLQFVAYEAYWTKELKIQSHRQSLNLLAHLGFPVSHNIGFFGQNTRPLTPEELSWGWAEGDKEPLKSHWQHLSEFIENQLKKRESLDYEIDGLVIKVNDLLLREVMGHTAHHPRWALAFKFDFQQGNTRLNDIVVQIGRTGRATPLALVEPLELMGACISRVTLHNQVYINELGLKKGDVVSVSRRGDVIPAVERVVSSAQEGSVWQMPVYCPACQSLLLLEGAHHFCPNTSCPARLKAQLYYFVGKKQMDIQTLSRKTIDLLFDKGLVRKEADLYALDSQQLENLQGMGKKKVEQLQTSIEKSKQQNFERVMRSLGLKEIGANLIELLALAGYTSFDDYVNLAQDPLGVQKLKAIKGIGSKLAENFSSLILSLELQEKVKDLKKVGLNFNSEKRLSIRESLEGPFKGEVWCITGSFEHFKNRQEIQELIHRLGAETLNQISKKVTHLLVGARAGGKKEQAKRFSISCVSEQEFILRLKKAELSLR
ncbi:UNVERIFIED_CONTAM: hypothetical protein PYX00_011003 [Menopon gallinae]|uniref:DNA ligase (NAD(+)) n=1 Tax=Menopon gallinae TaxID=328185 RepID=A0AAW2H6B9_9NEOP